MTQFAVYEGLLLSPYFVLYSWTFLPSFFHPLDIDNCRIYPCPSVHSIHNLDYHPLSSHQHIDGNQSLKSSSSAKIALLDPYSQLPIKRSHTDTSNSAFLDQMPHFLPNLALSPVICISVSSIHHLPNYPSGNVGVISELYFLSAYLFI